MEIVASSFLALVVVVALLIKGPYHGLWLFFVVTPFGAAAAINLPAAGGASILVVDLAALTLFAIVAAYTGGLSMIAGSMRYGQPGFWLLLLTLFAIVATLLFPTLFRGETEVFSISRKANESGIVSIPLRPSSGNITQLFRLFLGVAAFFATVTVFRLRPDAQKVLAAIAIATGVNAFLGWLDVATYAVGMPELLEPIRSANYAMLYDVRMVGLKRMIGGFPEASSFGYYSLGLFGFWLQFWIATPRSRLAAVMLALAAVAVLRSTSSAAYVSLVVFLVMFGLIAVVSGLRANVQRRGATITLFSIIAVWVVGILLFAAYEFLVPVTDFLERALFNKMSGNSGVERMSWNTQAFQNFLDTKAMGAGLGSVRASSWFVATLASLGVIGTLLFVLFILSILTQGEGRRGTDMRSAVIQSLRAGCLAFLISAMLTSATPDLGLTFFAFAGLAAGLARGAVIERRSVNKPDLKLTGRNNKRGNSGLRPKQTQTRPVFPDNLAKS